MNNDNTQRLSSQSNDGEEEVGSLLAAASDFARGVLESIQALAGTTACKGVQIARLKDWANDGHLYFIDTIIYESGTGGRETYNSLSPRASKV